MPLPPQPARHVRPVPASRSLPRFCSAGPLGPVGGVYPELFGGVIPFPFDFQLSTVNCRPSASGLPPTAHVLPAVATRIQSLLHCLPHGGFHIEHVRYSHPSGWARSVPKVSVSLTNHKTKVSKTCSSDL